MIPAWLLIPPPTGDPTDTVDSSWLGDIPIGQVIAWIAMVALVLLWMWKQSKILRPLGQFFRDWNGEKPRPGVDARPGTLERIKDVETSITTLARALGGIVTREEFDQVRQQVATNTAVIGLIIPPSMRVHEETTVTETTVTTKGKS